ncbi:MAG: S-methyl-5-thioribose-1-phosphate isomerase [Actinomycetales bacterium mxb001]|nr:MAG: S-methyl-5-thioribose-1-phosphate isomerase [Actinomycetales bacterium mxb001]
MHDVRAVHWDDVRNVLVLLDQTQLPAREDYRACDDVDSVVDSVQRLVVRGAPALGAVGAYGVAVAMRQGQREGWSDDRLRTEIVRIRDARPTAVNLAWGVDRVTPLVPSGIDAVVAEAHVIVAEDQAANRELSRLGADWILNRVERRPVRVLTHCNTGDLATTGWGTALGIIRELHERGQVEMVYADETRPLLQGARLTAWECARQGIPCCVQADGAAASTILRGLVDVAIIGADRIARNGDTANKIGSVGVALACDAAGIPFVVAAPSSTVDMATPDGSHIEIELRNGDEVTTYAGSRVAPEGADGFNPAFDVTPARYVSAVVTERAVVEPDGVSPVSALVGE